MLLVKEPKHPERNLLVERIFDTILYAAAVSDFGNLFTTLFPTPTLNVLPSNSTSDTGDYSISYFCLIQQ